MLRSMVLDNFQSFDHIELDLTGKNRTVKNHAFIYGENGSGKSNLINAMFLLLVSSGTIRRDTDSVASIDPTGSDESLAELVRALRMIDCEGNTRLDFIFAFNGSDARYVLEFNAAGTLVRECLSNKINSRKGILYRLEEGNEPYFVRGLIKDKRFRDKIRSELAQYWGNRSLLGILNEDIRGSNRQFIDDNVNPNLLSFIDGINSITVESKMFLITKKGQIRLPSGTIPSEDAEKLDVVEKMLSKFFSRLYSDVTGAYFRREIQNGRMDYELFFRKRISGKVREIPADWESTGTKNMMNVMGSLLSCVAGGCVFVDEMDTGVHDLLITSVMEQTIPEIKGQLIATTHNTCLMDTLSADNVYVIGIDRNGFKKIRCVSSIERIRPQNSIRHKYYEGNLMGIPYIANLDLDSIAEIGKEDE
ncbi:ATP/GTP-binding protein [Methanomethylophilus alvi]|uniref:ATP/GTP-binding protein n=2 Tax=Methanomethylophilus alvi TaxID=1291540 RepID=UPI0037DD05CC